MKKTISLLLAFTFLFTAASPCFADTVTESEIDNALIQRGYPQEILDEMSLEEKEKIYTIPEMIYVDSFSINYSEPESNSSAGTAQPYGQISTNDLSLRFVISQVVNSSNQLQYLYITFHYEWLNLPFWRLDDCISVSWDETKFRLLDNSFVKKDLYSGYFIDGANQVHRVYDEVYSVENGYANASPSGVSWYADLADSFGMNFTELYGYGSFTLVPAHGTTVTSGTSFTLYAHYVHPILWSSVSIDIPGFGSFSVTGSTYDERGTQKSFSIISNSPNYF